MKILILGYGHLGQAFCRLYRLRYEIRGIKRTPLLGEPCPVIRMPIQSQDLLSHLAWANVILFCPSSDRGDLDRYRETYLGNIEFVTGMIIQNKLLIQSFVAMGSTGVYPKSTGAVWKEDSDIPIESPRQEIIRKTEETLIRSGIPYVILRCGGLYGPGRANFSRVIRKSEIKSSEMSSQFLSMVHQEDVCRVIEKIIEGKKTGVVYNVVDDSNLRRKDWYRMIAAHTGIPIVDTGAPPEDPDRYIPNHELKASLEFEFHYSLDEDFISQHPDAQNTPQK